MLHRRKKIIFILFGLILSLNISACEHNDNNILSDGKNKVTLTFGLFDASPRESKFSNIYDYLKSYIKSYNQSNDNIKIEIISYGTSDDPDAYLKAITAVNSKNMPDLMLITGLPCESFAEKGCFANLYQYIDSNTANNSIDKNELFSGPLKAMEYKSGLYWLSPEFSVISFYGLSSVLGNNDKMSISELFEIWDIFDKNNAVFMPDAFSAADAFKIIMSTGIYRNYINTETSTCDFYNNDFINLLELFKTLPNEFPKTSLQQSYEVVLSQASVCENEAVLGYCELLDLYSMDWTKSFSADNDLKFIGVPWISEKTALCHLSMPISISEYSLYKDEAWIFIKSLLNNYNRYVKMGTMFPLKKSMLETYLEEHGYFRNWELFENGDESVLSSLTREFLPPYFSIEDMNNNSENLLPPITATFLREDYNELLSLIDTASIPLITKPHSSPFDITLPEFKIIMEEALAYFNGNQSSKDAALNIQARVSTYMSEQS